MTHANRSLLSILFASLMFGMTTASADGLSDISERGVLKVAVPQDFPPFGSVGPDLKPRGLDIDTAQLLADKLSVKACLCRRRQLSWPLIMGSPGRLPLRYLQPIPFSYVSH